MICGMDIGSTTCKYFLAADGGDAIDQQYERHNTKQAEKVLDFLRVLEQKRGLTPGRDRIFLTGSGAGLIAPLLGAKVIQEVVAVGATVEKLHPSVKFVSEIGGEDMKTIFFTGSGESRSKQVLMQSACSGGTGTFIEKTGRKLSIPLDQLARMRYEGYTLHKISSKCGIFAEVDANVLLKAGISVEEIIASLFEAVVYQNLSTLTRGNTPAPEVLLLGGPNLFYAGLQEAWRQHLERIWKERKICLPEGKSAHSLVHVPSNALYYAAQGCIEVGRSEPHTVGLYHGIEKLKWWIEEGQHEQKRKAGKISPWGSKEDLKTFLETYGHSAVQIATPAASSLSQIIVGCDFGSTTAKAVCLTPDANVVFSCYTLSKGNPIEDAKAVFRQVRQAVANAEVLGLGITGYGKDLLKDIIGADCAVVETVAHATAGLHFFPDADCICDVGGVDVKVMILSNGTVSDFRLNSQCSSGNGAFLQGVAERFNIPLAQMAEAAFGAEAVPQFSMGCGVFLQSDIVNQQRKGWQAEEILAGLAAVLPLNVWIYAGGVNNMSQIGRKFILQGGTHKNLAVVKAQVDFLRSKVADAEVLVHPYSAEAGAIGAGLVALERWQRGGRTRFRGFDVIGELSYKTTTSLATVCNWCAVNCQRSFIDVALEGAEGRRWSKVPITEGFQRVIVNNSCAKGLVEDPIELRVVKDRMEKIKNAYPNVADRVRNEAFRGKRTASA